MKVETLMKKRTETESIDYFLVRMYNEGTKTQSICAIHELWRRFEKLTYKMKNKLLKIMYDNGMRFTEDVYEYESRAYETFIKAIDSVDLKRCKHLKKTWGAYIVIWGFLMSMNRDIVKHYMVNCNSTTEIHSLIRNDSKSESNEHATTNLDAHASHHYVDVADALEAQEKRNSFWESYNLLEQQMNRKEKKLVKLRSQGMTMRAISSEMGIKQSEYRSLIDGIKTSFIDILRSRGESYEEVVNYFNA